MQQLTKTNQKAIQVYCETLTSLIADARAKVLEAGAPAKVMYIGDILPKKKDELRLSPMLVETGCKIFGMDIIIDYRIPMDKFYITSGRLER